MRNPLLLKAKTAAPGFNPKDIWRYGGWLLPNTNVVPMVRDEKAALEGGAVKFDPDMRGNMIVERKNTDRHAESRMMDFMKKFPPPETLNLRFKSYGAEEEGAKLLSQLGSRKKAVKVHGEDFFIIPLNSAAQVAQELVKSGLDFDTDAKSIPERVYFMFRNEAELEVAHEIVRQAFRKQIESGKDDWANWKQLESLQNLVEGPEKQKPYVASLLQKIALNVPRLVKDFGQKFLMRYHADQSAPTPVGLLMTTKGTMPFAEPEKAAETLIGLIAQQDPTPNKEYTAWLTGNYARGGIARFEDIAARAIPALKRFHALKLSKKIPNEERDIGRIKGLEGLETLIEKYTQVETTSKTQQEANLEQQYFQSGEAQLVHDDATIKVVIPKTAETSCYFGINTRWCTAGRSGGSMFESYNKRGPLYIVLIKAENERYQFHFQSGQYMDEKDKSIDTWELVGEYPILRDIFNDVVVASTRDSHLLPEPDALAFVKKPTKRMLLKALDDDPTVIQYFPDAPKEVKWKAFTQRAGVEGKTYDQKAKAFILSEWSNVEEFAKENGDDSARYAASVSSGDEWIEASGGSAEEALEASKPKTIAEINEYIKFHYADELEAWRAEEGQDADDSLDSGDILRFIADRGLDEIEQKLMAGWYSGTEVGTQDEIIKSLKSALDDLKREGTEAGTIIVVIGDYWDSPVRELLPLATAQKWVAEHPNDYNLLEETIGWSEIGEKIKVEQPYYGWSGWSEEAADERISEEFHISDKERKDRAAKKELPLFDQSAAKKKTRKKKQPIASEKEAGPKSRALLPAALLGLMAPGAGSESPEIGQPAPVVRQMEKPVTIDQLVEAIARSEGAHSEYNLHNPGNLVGFHSGELLQFKSDSEGIHALKKVLYRIADGKNPKYTPDMTLEEAGLVYSGGDPNWAKNVSRILKVDLKTPFVKLIKGTAKIAAAADTAHGIASEALKRMAGAWGERSYDNDSVHDILDRHRPKANKELGFDQPIPEENVESLLDDADELIVSSDAPDNKERFFGVMVFLETHGTPLDRSHKQMAAAVGNDLLRNKKYLGRWKDPAKRKLQLKRELRLFGEQTSLLPSIVAAERDEPNDPVCACGHTFYSHSDNCEHCESCPGFDSAPIEEQVDYVCERRSFSLLRQPRIGKRKNPATYERHDGDMVLKVWFKDGKVEKAEFESKGKNDEPSKTVKPGWDGFFSFVQTYGD